MRLGRAGASARRLATGAAEVLPVWMAARLILLLGFTLAVAVTRHVHGDTATPEIDQGLFAWDGAIYRDLAESGYPLDRPDLLKFFPLFPLAGRALAALTALPVGTCLLLIANLCSLAVLVMIRRLVMFETGRGSVADRAVDFVALSPAAFVLSWSYSEPLFLVGAVGTFLMARTHRWKWVPPFAVVAGLTRPVGVLLVVPLAVEVSRGWSASRRGERVSRAVALSSAPLALCGHLYWVHRTFGDWRLPQSEQSLLRGDLVNPVTRLVQGIGEMVGSERFGDGLHVPFVLAMIVLVAVSFRHWPVSYGLFSAAALVVSLSAENLNSVERYGLSAFPLWLALATVTRSQRQHRYVLVLSGAGALGLSALAWLGLYVP